METEVLQHEFKLNVLENGAEWIPALVGTSITLDTQIKLQMDHYVIWTRGRDFGGDPVALWQNNKTVIMEAYRDVLQLNPLSGSITFVRVSREYSGFYCMRMMLYGDPYILRQYHFVVFDPVPLPNISVQNNTRSQSEWSCHVECYMKNALNETLSWYRGEKEINQTRNPDISSNLSLPLIIQEQDGGIYTCMAANPVNNQTVNFNSTYCPHHAPEKTWIYITIGFGVGAGLVLMVLIIVYVWRCCRYHEGSMICIEMNNVQQETASQQTRVSEVCVPDSGSNMEAQVLLSNN
ncbi:hypothetical protein LDENG_00124950 [Lucifuga dentata]|nr:hypothetical protein LDENG_00124950 [Lucifuga dentata]